MYFFSILKCKAENSPRLQVWGKHFEPLFHNSERLNNTHACYCQWGHAQMLALAADWPHRGLSRLPGFRPVPHGAPYYISLSVSPLVPLNTDLKAGLQFWSCVLPILKSFIRGNAFWLLVGLSFINRLFTVLPSNSVSSLSLQWLKILAGARNENFSPLLLCLWQPTHHKQTSSHREPTRQSN